MQLHVAARSDSVWMCETIRKHVSPDKMWSSVGGVASSNIIAASSDNPAVEEKKLCL
jgi:hypothetical protein